MARIGSKQQQQLFATAVPDGNRRRFWLPKTWRTSDVMAYASYDSQARPYSAIRGPAVKRSEYQEWYVFVGR